MKSNYYKFLISNSILFFGLGLFTPFWIIFIKDFGGIEQFGFAMGLMVLAQSATSYTVGRYSDRFGKKIFLIGAGFVMSGVIFAYTLISSVIALYVLQIINGVLVAIQQTIEKAILGDLTEKVSRGTDVGRYEAITSIMVGLAMMLGGLVVGDLGIKVIFYITSALVFLSSVLLLKIPL